MSPITISIENLTKTFGSVAAVDNLSLAVQQGQFVALLGPSGCGKTTTLRLVAGFEEPDQGIIKINETIVNGPKQFLPPEKRSVGMVFQSYALFPHLNVAQNVAYGLPRNKEREKHVEAILDLVQLNGLGKRMPHELSGGQQQRVALARALAPHPDLILLDEPFSNLDASLRHIVRQEVRQILRQAGATTIFVTHDQEEALSLCDMVAVMIGGQLMQFSPPHILYNYPVNKEVAAFMGDANFLPGMVKGDTVECELGQFPVHNNAIQGAVEVMLRPEEVPLVADETGLGVVVEQQYFGHDQLLICRLASGTIIRSRLVGPVHVFSPGQRVHFTLPEKVVVF